MWNAILWWKFPYDQLIIAVRSDEQVDEKAKAPVVQQKGRFKVTSENVDLEKVIFKDFSISAFFLILEST